MNSILHTCTHANSDTLTRMTDDQMYAAIFSYIEHLFEIIKPNKVFYMAIDGVAPRAKMNQQRARRFRTAYEAEVNLKKAIEEGAEIPKEDPFDSNCITPGTEFMAKLTDNLKYFIHKKITEDSNWANIEIILSGHEAPGEGEHKIMEYIRAARAQPDYNPNLRHCIYGLDADLIMLGLVSHDPHFALLREEVTFGPGSSKKTDLHEQRFYLLHLSLVREYLELEFSSLQDLLSFEYNFDRILDDFILIMYVLGNDFLPNLPDLFINKGAFPLLIATFKQLLLHTDGYINENGTINLKRLSLWLNYLSEFELENFEKQDVDVEWFNKKLENVSLSGERKRKRSGKLLILKEQKKLVGLIKPWLMETASHTVAELNELENASKLKSLRLPHDETVKNLDFIKELALECGFLIIHSKSEDTYDARLDIDGLSPYENAEEYEERINDLRKTIKRYQSAILVETEELLQDTKDIYDTKFMDWKDKYYKDKLKFSINDTDKLVEMTSHYVEGLQWVLYYYYRGVPSWNWFYKYHYSPRISDISVGLDALIEKGTPIEFEKSKPFKPFEQLMAVLPARSKGLMPVVYRSLMTDEKSPIINFYPHEVDIDMNGKTAPWEAVVLLDFVDENKLIEALKPIEAKLTPEETKRNSFGKSISFVHNLQIDHVYPSPLPGFFKDIEHDTCYEKDFSLPEVETYVNGLIEGAKVGKELLAGFPSLLTIPFQSELQLNETKVFNYPSKSESMVLTIENVWNDMSTHQFAQQFLGKLVYSRWPFLAECKIVKVVDQENAFEIVKTQSGGKRVVTNSATSEDVKDFKIALGNFKYTYQKTKGVDLGTIDALVYVQAVNGLIRTPKGAYVKTFSKDIEVFPLQLIVKEVVNKDERFLSRPPVPIDEEFPLNSQVVFLGDMGYGAPSQIVGYNDDKDKLSIKISKIQKTAEPTIGKKRLSMETREFKYYPSFQVSKHLQIHPLLLSRITTTFIISDDLGRDGAKVNIGLDLRFESKRLKTLGYTRKQGENSKVWEFSPLAIDLIKKYQEKFPNIFSKLSSIITNKTPIKSSMITSAEELKEIKAWLKTMRADVIPVSLESESFTKFSFQAIEKSIIEYINQPIPLANKDIKGVPRDAVLNPGESYQLLSAQKFELGDRIIYIQDFGKVPILSKGTVASIITTGNKVSLGVIFDFPLINGTTMNGKLTTKRGLVIDSSLVLNLTNRQFVYHSKASKSMNTLSGKPKAQAKKQQVQAQKNKQEKQEKQEAVNAKQSHELLSILKGKNDKKDEEKSKDSKEAAGEELSTKNHNAIKQIYGQIYSNVMNEGQVPQYPNPGMPMGAPPMGPPQGYGFSPQVPGPYGSIPVVPGIPLPPQFYTQNPPPPQFPPQNVNGQDQQNVVTPVQETDEPKAPTESNRGRNSRGGYRGKSSRGRGKPRRGGKGSGEK